jgi:hypothetical protein
MDKCKKRYGNKLTVSTAPFETNGPDDDDDSGKFVPYKDDTTFPVEMPVAEATDLNGKFINMDHVMDNYINKEIRFPIGESEVFGKVIVASLDRDGKVIGSPNENSFLNTVLYDVEFEDGICQQYGANIIAENMLQNVDNEGHHSDTLHYILDLRLKPNAVKDGFITEKHGRRRMRKTTAGVDLLVAIRDGIDANGKDKVSKTWIPLKDIKEDYPIEVAGFAITREVGKLPAFVWWVHHVMKKRDHIIASVKTRVKKTTHKYSVEVPTSIDHAK